MRFTVEVPPGWTRTPFPAPQRGLYLHAPPGGARGAMLLMDAITAHGTLADQLAAAVRTGCSDAQLLAEGAPIPFVTVAELPGLSIPVRLRVTHDRAQRDELRVFSLVDAGTARLPTVFLGDVDAAAVYQQAIGLILYTIRPA